MKKNFILIFLIFTALITQAQDYLINFTGTGDTSEVETIEVNNLTSGANLTLNRGEILHLIEFVGIEEQNKPKEFLNVFPNPMIEQSTLSYFAPSDGYSLISIVDLFGKTVYQVSKLLSAGTQRFSISGLKQGMYIINIRGSDFTYSKKLMSFNNSPSEPKLKYIATSAPNKKSVYKNNEATVEMPYTEGDILLFKSYVGEYSTILTDIPVSNKTITFDFVACTDADGNNYPVVQIGTQIWMAENLKTTKYNDGSEIPLVTSSTDWSALSSDAYGWYNNDTANKGMYGALYNGYAVNTSKLNPLGWRVATDSDWKQLEMALGLTQKDADTTGWRGANQGIKLQSTTVWPYKDYGTNSSGFSAFPGGYHSNNGNFNDIGSYGNWWSSTVIGANMWVRRIHASGNIERENYIQTLGFSIRCLRDVNNEPVIPIVSTSAACPVLQTIATIGGVVISDGGALITARGMCWSTSPAPTVDDSHTSESIGSGGFTSSLTDLTANTTYYGRAYASNNVGLAYGNEVMFTTSQATGGTVTDVDNNLYNTLTIGSQVWMTENLKTTRYNDGTEIPLVTKNSEWELLKTPGYCWYNNGTDIANKNTFGALYNWHTVNTGKLAPIGWHVATDSDWKQLEMALGMSQQQADAAGDRGTDQATKLKNANGWYEVDNGANTIGFSALPGGYRIKNGSFVNINTNGCWWTSTDNGTIAIPRMLGFGYAGVGRESSGKMIGYSVRCVKD